MWCTRTVISKESPTVLLCSVMLLGLMGCVGIGGTQIHLAHDTLSMPNQTLSEFIVMQKFAEDRRATNGRIGHATMSAFAGEIGDVTTTDPLTEEVVMQVKQALESLGYQVTLVDSAHPVPNSSSIVKVNIKEFYFKNYNWLWPLVPTFGSIELGLTIENPDRKVLYEKSFRGSGNSYCLTGECAFGTATKEALTKILNKIVEGCSGKEFLQALKN